MRLNTKHIGTHGGKPSAAILLTVEGNGSTITEDITDLWGNVNEDFITSLRDLADELEEQNTKLQGAE